MTTPPCPLLPCPWCRTPLRRNDNKFNPSARCVTEGCYGGKMPVVNLDVPEDVTAWNTRTPPQSGDGAVERKCTCHPDDNPPKPCAKRYALQDCLKAALTPASGDGAVASAEVEAACRQMAAVIELHPGAFPTLDKAITLLRRLDAERGALALSESRMTGQYDALRAELATLRAAPVTSARGTEGEP